MRFIRRNFIETTTSITVGNTALASLLIDGLKDTQYVTLGDNSDLTTSSIHYSLTSSEAIDKILLLNQNFKKFRLFYDGATANSFTIVNGQTTTSIWDTNSDTSLYIDISTVTVSSITLEITETITADQEKEIGEFTVSKNIVTFPRNPSHKGYKPLIKRKQIVHELSDGSTKLHNVANNYKNKLKFKYLDTATTDDLWTAYEDANNFWFLPFETSTSWDGAAYEVVWAGNFDFLQYSDNVSDAGFNGTIDLRET